MSYKCAAAGCEYASLDAADMKRHMALEHVLVIKNADGTGTAQRNALVESHETSPTCWGDLDFVVPLSAQFCLA